MYRVQDNFNKLSAKTCVGKQPKTNEYSANLCDIFEKTSSRNVLFDFSLNFGRYFMLSAI